MDIQALFIRESDCKDTKSRLGQLIDWLNETEADWWNPPLAAYRMHLETLGKRESSIDSVMATIRGRYRTLIGSIRPIIEMVARDGAYSASQMMEQFALASIPERSSGAFEIIQDQVDDKVGNWLTREQASALIATPGHSTLLGLRDTAMWALMLSTGLREAEVTNLNVRDLRQTLDGTLCVHVRRGKGSKTRAVPYGAAVDCLKLVDQWLEAAHITKGRVFRSFWKGHSLRDGSITPRSIQKALARYTHVTPMDLRRTYARRCYLEGMDLLAIKENMGHVNLDSTLGYIGLLGSPDREPPDLYDWPDDRDFR